MEAQLELEVGKFYFFRGVTMIYTGEFVSESTDYVVLKKAAWIADTGRFADALKDPEKFKEVEPYPQGRPVRVYKAPLLDVVEIDKLVLEQR